MAKKAHDDLIAAAFRVQADALLIQAAAQRRLADEYDAAQERGEVATRSDQNLLPEEKKVSVAEIGLTYKDTKPAREKVAPELWTSPEFVRTNYIITAVWALAFVVLVIADLILVYFPDVPARVGIIATIAALVGAVKFTSWYPEHRRAALSGR